MVYINLIFFLISIVLLVIAGSLLVRSASNISRFLRMPEFIVGFVLMAIATSIPELFVGITSALNKNPALALGTVIGSNIANLTLVAGISILLVRKVKIQTKESKIDSLVMVGISILPLILMIIGRQLSRLDGIILLAVFILYFNHVLKRRKAYTKEFEDHRIARKAVIFYSFLFIFSIALLFFSADWTVKFGSGLAFDLNFPPILIGLFLIALGTSLPELVFGAKSMLTGHSEMSVGNLIGSNIANVSLVLGITALIHPIQADFILFLTSAIYMVVVSLIFTAFVESKRFTTIAGISLVFMYVFFLLIEFYIQGTVI